MRPGLSDIGESDAGATGDDRTPDGVAEAEAHSVGAVGRFVGLGSRFAIG